MEKQNEVYLTVKELSEKIKFSKQTIYNLIHQRVFILGQHYVKPRPKKILFIWSAISNWLTPVGQDEKSIIPHPATESDRSSNPYINI